MIRLPIRRGSCPKVSLGYVDAAGEASMRLVAPVAVITSEGARHHPEGTYLQAKCSIAKALRTFRYDRIESVSDPATGELLDLIPWTQQLQLGHAQAFDWASQIDEQPEEEPSDPAVKQSAAQWQQPTRWSRIRPLLWTILIGYSWAMARSGVGAEAVPSALGTLAMKKIIMLLAPLAVTQSFAASAMTQPTTGQLIKQEQVLDENCRGIPSAQTPLICAQRDALDRRLQTRGLCWGPDDAIEADKHWMRCGTAARPTN